MQQKLKEQAALIRQCNPENQQKVSFIQGEIDGSLYILNLLEEQKKQITSEDGANNPTY